MCLANERADGLRPNRTLDDTKEGFVILPGQCPGVRTESGRGARVGTGGQGRAGQGMRRPQMWTTSTDPAAVYLLLL